MTDDPFRNIMRPNPIEADYAVSQIEGEIPRELHGTLYRNCPNQKILPKAGPGALHLFDGDGFVSAVRFEDGKAHYRGRYARTPSFLREQEEGVFCLGTIGASPDRPLHDPPPNQQANTNAVFHAGRLFAMVENAPPFEMDPVSLESKRFWDYDGKMLGMATSAHPRIDGKTGQMIQSGYQCMKPYVQLYTVEPDGNVSLAEPIDSPWPGMIHDIAITENHVIIPLGAIDLHPEGASESDPLTALKSLRARPDLNLRFGIRKRELGSPTRWFETASSHYIFHLGNAYERDGKIMLDACTFEEPSFLLPNIKKMRGGQSGGSGLPRPPHPYLYEFDLELIAGQGIPSGVARPTDGGYRIDGNWSYGSGIQHADYIHTGCVVLDEDGNRRTTDTGALDIRICLVERRDVEIKDNWDVLGLRGTGSFDYSIRDLLVPKERTHDFAIKKPLRGSYQFTLGLTGYTAWGHTGFALGVGRHALEELTTLAQTKGNAFGLLGEGASFQERFARAEAGLRAARSFAYTAWDDICESMAREEPASLDQVALVRLAMRHAHEVVSDVCTFAHKAAGGVSLRPSPLQRCYRDIHAGTQHILLSDKIAQDTGRVLLGMAPKDARWSTLGLETPLA